MLHTVRLGEISHQNDVFKDKKSTGNGIISVLFKITFTSSYPPSDSGSAQNQLFYDHKNKSSFINRAETVNKV